MLHKPTLAGFLNFIRTVMQIPAAALPDNSPVITIAFDVSIEIVNPQFNWIGASLIYELAVYNLAGSNLLNYATDPLPPTFFINVNGTEVPYFQALRQQLGMTSFVAGVIQSTSDESTAESLMVPDALKGLTLANLQQLKDPYGRQYLAFAQDYGSLWGLS